MQGFTDSIQNSSSFAPLVEALRSFESVYAYLRQGNSLENFSDTGMLHELFSEKADGVREKIENLFVPLLSQILSSPLTPGTEEVAPLYVVVPAVRNYLALSNYFLSSSMEYLCSLQGEEMRKTLKVLLGRSTEIMEYHASYILENIFKDISESSARSLITAFTHPDFTFADPALDFERIPAAHAELTHCQFGNDDHVLFVGCGSLSVSGLAYANAGANVTLVDIDPVALESFSRVFNSLPESLQRRMNRRVVNRDEYCYISEGDYTHIGLAGLVGAKDEILRSIQHCLQCQKKDPIVMVRAPKPNLLRLFYYDANVRAVAQKRYLVSDPGIEAPIVTHMLTLDRCDGQCGVEKHDCSVLSRVFVKNETGIEFPILLS